MLFYIILKIYSKSSFRWFWPTEAQSFPIRKWLSASRAAEYEERTSSTAIRHRHTKRVLLRWITSLYEESYQKELHLTNSRRLILTIWWTTSILTAEPSSETEHPTKLLRSITARDRLKSLDTRRSIQVVSWWHRSCLRDNERINLTVDTLILWCIRGSVLDFKKLKFRPTSCLVRPFDTLTAVLPLAFCLQIVHFAYKTCISFTNRAFEITNLRFVYNCCTSFYKCDTLFYY